jgi:hypothetical protein
MERVEDYKKKPTKKSLYYRKRCYGMTSLDRISVEKKRQQLDMVTKVKLIIDDSSDSDVDSLIDYLETTEDFILEDIRQIEELNPLFHQPLPRIERKYRTIDSFEETEVS